MNVERIAGTIRKEFCVILGQDSSESFKFDADTVVGWAIRGPVEAETDYEDALINTELNRIATTAVAPLVASIGRRLKPVANLKPKHLIW